MIFYPVYWIDWIDPANHTFFLSISVSVYVNRSFLERFRP